MRELTRSRGIPIPTSREVLVVAGLAFAGWWGWGAFTESQVRHNLWNPEANASERIRAVEAWAELGADGVPDLIAALTAHDPRTRRYVALALSRLGPLAAPAIPSLMNGLRDPEADVRINAAIALTRIDEDSAHVAQAVTELLADDDGSVRAAVAETLREWTLEPIPEVVAMLESPSPRRRQGAILVLRRVLRSNAELSQAVHRLTTDPDPSVQDAAKCALLAAGQATRAETAVWLGGPGEELTLAALDAVRRLGPEGETLLPELSACLDRGDERLHFRVLRILRGFRTGAAPAIPRILEYLETAHPEVIPDALEVLAVAGADREILVPLLSRYVQQDAHRISSIAARLLQELDAETARETVPQLASALRGIDRRRLDAACSALWTLGPDSAAAVPELTALLRHEEANLRSRAAEILKRIGPGAASAVVEIQALLDEPNAPPGLRESLVEAAGAIGRPARSIGPRLMQLLAETEEAAGARNRSAAEFCAPFRCRIIVAMARVGYRTPEFLNILRRSLEQPVPYERMAAMEGYATLDLRDRAALVPFLESCSDADPSLRLTAFCTAPEGVGPEPEMIRALARGLEDPHPLLRRHAAQALSRMGRAARQVIPDLERALSDDENRQPTMDRTRRTGLLPVRPFAQREAVYEFEEQTVAESIILTLGSLVESRPSTNN